MTTIKVTEEWIAGGRQGHPPTSEVGAQHYIEEASVMAGLWAEQQTCDFLRMRAMRRGARPTPV